MEIVSVLQIGLKLREKIRVTESFGKKFLVSYEAETNLLICVVMSDFENIKLDVIRKTQFSYERLHLEGQFCVCDDFFVNLVDNQVKIVQKRDLREVIYHSKNG